MNAKSKRQSRQPQARFRARVVRLWPVILLGAVILFFSAIRIRLLTVPLERDEGEYAYAGQLMLQGIAPYKLAYNMKLPGTYAAYALIMAVFGQTPAAIHLGMILANAGTIVMVFLLGKRLFDDIAGITAACSYALLSNSESVLGFAGHATHFVVLGALAGVLCLLEAIDNRRRSLYFLSGVFMGVAFVMKQPGLAFVLFGAFHIIVSERRELKTWPGFGRLALYGAGAIVPFALTCLVLSVAGQLAKMWFWTFSYASQYASVTILWEGWENFFTMCDHVVGPCFLVWILALLGLAAMAWDSRLWKRSLFTISFLLFSGMAVCAGFYFRPHYFILMLPAVSLLAGITVSSATHELSKFVNIRAATAIPAVVFIIVLAISVAAQSDVFFHMDPVAVSRSAYGTSPFPEAEVISQYLNRQTGKDAHIAVLGSEPEIFFSSHRRSATGYIYIYPLFEPQKFALQMQKEMAREIEDSNPEYVVLVKVGTSWGVRPTSDRWILTWLRNYVSEHYQIVGVADEITPQTRYVWGDAAKTYNEESDSAVEIFRRSNLPPSPS